MSFSSQHDRSSSHHARARVDGLSAVELDRSCCRAACSDMSSRIVRSSVRGLPRPTPRLRCGGYAAIGALSRSRFRRREYGLSCGVRRTHRIQGRRASGVDVVAQDGRTYPQISSGDVLRISDAGTELTPARRRPCGAQPQRISDIDEPMEWQRHVAAWLPYAGSMAATWTLPHIGACTFPRPAGQRRM